MIKGNIRRSEKRLRIMLKTGLCLAALTGAYFGAPTVCDKIAVFRQEKAMQEHLKKEAEEAHKRAMEDQIRYQFDCDLIKEIETVEKGGKLRYYSAHIAFMNLMKKDRDARSFGKISDEEYQVRSNQYNGRHLQLKQIEGSCLSKNEGQHPLIQIITQERYPVKTNTANAVFQYGIEQSYTR